MTNSNNGKKIYCPEVNGKIPQSYCHIYCKFDNCNHKDYITIESEDILSKTNLIQ